MQWKDLYLSPINLWSLPRVDKRSMEDIDEEFDIDFRIDPLSANMRFYVGKLPKTLLHLTKQRYYKILTLQFLDNGEIRVSGAQEAPNKREMKIMHTELGKLGYVLVTYRHRNSEISFDLTVPFEQSMSRVCKPAVE